MSISKATELIIKLKHLPGFGPKTVEVVAKAMIERNLFSDNDIVSYVQECVKNHYIRLNKELTPDLFQKAIDEAQRVLDKSVNNGVHVISQYDNLFPIQLKELKSYSNNRFKERKFNRTPPDLFYDIIRSKSIFLLFFFLYRRKQQIFTVFQQTIVG